MEEGNTTRVGLDVRKASIDVTIAEAGAAGEVRHFGTVGGDLETVAKLIRRLRSSSSGSRRGASRPSLPRYMRCAPSTRSPPSPSAATPTRGERSSRPPGRLGTRHASAGAC